MSSIRIRRPVVAPRPVAPPSEEKEEQERTIAISIFDGQTRQEFLESPRRYLGNNKKVSVLKRGDLVLLYDYTEKEVFGICVLRCIDNDCIYREAHPYDKELYNGEYHKYNKYEIGVKTIIITPTPVNTIMRVSGLDEGMPLGMPHLGSFRRIFHPILPWIHRALAEAWLQES